MPQPGWRHAICLGLLLTAALRASAAPGIVTGLPLSLGESFASPASVSFRFFRLRTNDGMPGRPAYYFEFDHARRVAKGYCDVGDALKAELGVGPYQPTAP